MNTKQGFTLMEILAVLLVIAVIASFAVPLVKSVRREMRYQKAKAAAVQLAEVVRSFYTDSKGRLAAGGSITPETAANPGECPTDNPIRTGVPNPGTDDVKIVIACDYISAKMFVDLPYTFYVVDPRTSTDGAFVTGTEFGESSPRSFTVNRDMTITEED